MANKLFMVLVAMALIASQASATRMVDAFLALADETNLANFLGLLVWQVWAFLAPFVGGPLRSFLYYLWNEATFSIEADGVTYTLTSPEAFGDAGIGNFEQLFNIFMGVIPTALNNLIPGSTKLEYIATVNTIAETVGLTLP